jgi:ABC-2 type transport system permease protein
MKLRMHVIDAVFKRNFLSYFAGVIGYLFIVAFVGLGAFFAFNEQFFGNNLANLDQLNAVFPVLLLFFVPAITMTAWADERKLGTDELLFTLPASDLEILLGKYAAVLGIYTVALAFSLFHVAVLMSLGWPDFGLMFTTYFGYWIMGAALLSAGMVASVVTSSPTVAYVLGSLICSIPVFIDKIAVLVPEFVDQLVPLSRLLQGLSVSEQFRDFGLGMIPLSGVLYFASLALLMLYLNLVFISRRHWSGGPHRAPMGLHFLARSVCLAVILVSFNTVAAATMRRVDCTSEKLYSLAPTTREVLKGVKPERPVLIQAFISPEVPRNYAATRTSLIGLLRQIDQEGGNNVRVRIVSTDKFSKESDEAKRYGIEPQETQSERSGRFTRDDVYLGVVVSGSADDQVVVPFIDVGTPIEYELTRSIRTVTQAARKTLGVLRTDAQLTGGFDMQAFRQLPEWRIIGELKRQYEIKPVAPDELPGSKFDALLAVAPSSLTEPEMKNFIDYVKAGHPTLILDDPFPIFQSNLAPRMPKPRQGGGMMGGPPPQPKADDGKATKLTDALGIAWNSGETVWDLYNPHPEFGDLFELYRIYDVVHISPGNEARYALNPDSSITRGLQELMLFYPGLIKPREKSKLDFKPLLRTSMLNMTLDWEEYVSSGFMGMVQTLKPEFREPVQPVSQVVAAHITGSTGKDGESINVVFVADLDMISNEFFFIRDKEWQGLKLDNITFVLNAIDGLAGDESLIPLRSRRPTHRTLTKVEERTKQFKSDQAKEVRAAEDEAKKELEEARKRLREDIDKVMNDKSLDPRTKQIMVRTIEENANRRLQVTEANIQNAKNRRIKESKGKMEREVKGIEDVIRILAIAIPPIPALVLGIFVFAVRVNEERKGIVPDRLVHKHRS